MAVEVSLAKLMAAQNIGPWRTLIWCWVSQSYMTDQLPQVGLQFICEILSDKAIPNAECTYSVVTTYGLQ